jgi:hypothetical protein
MQRLAPRITLISPLDRRAPCRRALPLPPLPRPQQAINHFFGMLQLCRKCAMAARLSAMRALAPEAYAFCPATFRVPGEEAALIADAAARGRRQAYIIKPDAGCQVGRRDGGVQQVAGWSSLPQQRHACGEDGGGGWRMKGLR